jgi:hypothetical protein
MGDELSDTVNAPEAATPAGGPVTCIRAGMARSVCVCRDAGLAVPVGAFYCL